MGRFEAECAKAGSEPYVAGGSVGQVRGGIMELSTTPTCSPRPGPCSTPPQRLDADTAHDVLTCGNG
ncbi:hypothetical protein GCM10010345_68570 [Streptomyces canarius]|uniref:Uncharacterized protein n=1 Tax=Streptomyces canarius TaxID=285453 RepID=A0ABQ3D4F7_9ACTN|nr:hypothetical protein GCM10010345_68570 [Streptomyces canarius]